MTSQPDRRSPTYSFRFHRVAHYSQRAIRSIFATENPASRPFGMDRLIAKEYKKLSYRRETARQLPTWRGVGPPANSPAAPLATPMRMIESETRNKRTSSVPSTKRTLR